ncbi:hypothetical protein CBR_g33917 [Chara braunii]|uniref:Nucleoprotein TPR/MLP1-2 domain-containing protein n=1 Tax=Chara braunii TaxID=69332 RepID=A0A388LHE6_CHABU|nr:hypothetical protein CBR_g33917 [Chara braunii]|eukprot:GBG81739.1 hypothetical protein CBR_g33917 [Chara braunii]
MGRAQEQAAEKISTLKKHIEELEEDLSKTSSALSEVSQERERISQEAESEISSLKQTVASQRVEIEEARARINVLKQDVERHHKQWREAQNNYERQVMLQADTIRELSSASERLTRLEQVERAARARAETAEAELAALQVSWAAERAALESTRADAERKQRELEDQNSILLDRLEAKHVKSAEQSQRELAGNKELSTEHLVDTDADLEEVVRYLRRAKETADTELSLLKQERVRLQKQADAALRAAEDARTQLRVEQERNRASIQAEEEHRALVSQVQQLNLLRESNATLREENERNFREAKEWRDKAQKALAETDPLRGLLKEKDAELEAARKETLKIKEEVTLWQNRVKQLLEKYKSVDMEEYKQMRAELSSLKEHLKAVEQDIRSATAARAEAEEKLAKAEKELLNSASRLAEVEKELEACQASVKDLQIRLVNVRRAANKLQREKESVTKERDELKSTAEKATAAAEAALRDKGVSDAARQAAERHLKEDRLQAQSLKATAHAEALVDAQKEASAEAEILLRTEKEKVQKLEQEVQSWKHKDQRTKNNVLVAFQKAKSELDKLKNELKKIQAERDAYKHRIQQEGIQVGDQSESSGVPPDVTISADNAIAELEAFTKNEAEADLDTSLSLPNTSSPALNFGTTATTSRPGTPGNLIPAAASTGPENTAALGSQATASDMSLAAGEERQSQAASQSGAKIGQKVASGTATGTARSSAKSPVLAGVARPAPSSPAPVGSIALPPPAATALAGSGGLTSTSVTITTTTSTAASSGTVAAVGIVSSTVVSAAAAQARAVNLNQTQIDELRRKIKLAQHQEQMARTGTRRRLQRPPIEPPVSATSLATGAGMLDVESDLAVSGAGQATRKRPAGIESEVGGDLEGPGEKEDEGEVEGEPGPPSKRARPEDGELSAEEGEVQNEEFAAEETMSPLNEGLCKPSQDERDRSDDMEVPAQKRSRLDEPGAEERIDLGAREYCEENQGAEEVAKVDRDSTDGMEQDGMMSPVAAGCGPGGGERTVSTTTQVGEVETEAARQGMETLAEEKEAGETRDDGDQEEQAVVEGQEMVRERTPAAQVAAGEDEEEGDVRHSAGEPESDSGESLVFVEDSEIAGSDAEDNATEMTVDHSTEGVEHTDGHQESQDNGEPQSEGEVNLPRSQDGGDTGEGEEGSAIAKTPVRSTRAAVRAALGLRAGRGRGREGAHSPGIARGRGEQSGTGNAVGETESATRSRIINLRARRSTETSSSSRQGTSRGAVPTEPAGAGRAQPGRGAKVRRTGPAAASRRRVTSQGTGSSTPAFGSGAVGGGDSSAAPANTEPVPTGNMYALLDENNE